MVKKGRLIPLTVEGYASDGAGIARLDGLVIFVKGGIRGERCAVRIDKVGRSAVWGHAEEILSPSSARIEPECPYFGVCGGCQLRHMTYGEELELKRSRVEEALRRIGGADVSVPLILGAAEPDRYRNKAQFPVSPGPQVGFYRPRSHSVIDVEDCLLQSRSAARLRAAAADWMKRFQIPVYQERTGTGLVRHIYVRTNRAGQSLCCLLVNGKQLPHEAELVAALRSAEPHLAGVVLGINEKRNNVILGDSYRTLWGQDYLMDTLCGLSFKLSVPSFYQVNPAQAEVLYGQALDFAALTGVETVLDLYCGIGTISLLLARSAGKVYGVETVPEAVEDAEENAARNSIANAEFFCADAGEAAARFSAQGIRPQMVCVDPPRKGLAPEVIETVADMSPERVVYVSCDPGTLARDVGRFSALGYHAQRAVAVDMFPRTAHVETVCLLSKLQSKEHIEIEVKMDELDLTAAEKKATYEEIREYVFEHTGLKVSHLYIAQVKQKYGIIERENYNKPKSENVKQPQCPPEKEKAITEALKHFGMIL